MGVLDLPRYEEVREYLLQRSEQLEKSAISGEGELVSFFPGRFWPVLGDLATAIENDYNACDVESLNPMIDGLMWSRILKTPYCKGASVPILDRRSLPAFPNRNTEWDETLKGLNHVGRPGGEGEFLRPVGEYVHDLATATSGNIILETAHMLAHLRALACSGKKMSTRFLETLAELCIGLQYEKLTSITHWLPTPDEIADGEPRMSSWFDRHHVKVVVSTNMRKPWLEVPVRELMEERAQVVVLAGIHLEPQPWSAREGNPDPDDERWLEMNRWSCMPSIVCLSGWIGVDELMKAPLVLPYRNSGREDVCATLPVTALHPMKMFEGLVLLSHGGSGFADRGLFLTASDLCSNIWNMSLCVPPLPCKECLRLNMVANGAPTRPAVRRPPEDRTTRGRKARRLDEAEQAWAEYDAKVDKIYKVVENARTFWDARFGPGLEYRKRRRRNAKKVAELQTKTQRCKERIVRYEKNMEYTKAEQERGVLNELRSEVKKLLEG